MENLTIANFTMDRENKDEIASVCRALSATVRLDILELIEQNDGVSIVDLANKLQLAVSSAAFHVETLEKAKLIATGTAPGKHGTLRVCYPLVKKVNIELFSRRVENKYNVFTYNIPIGSYTDIIAYPQPTCGLSTENEILEQADNPSSFFSPRKMEAQIIWMSHGEITYKIPNYFLDGNTPHEISFSLELCSEAPFYNFNYPSDITVWINGVEITTYTSPGDYGDRHGKLTPQWWSNKLTQYGELVKFSVQKTGVYVNKIKAASPVTIDDLALNAPPYISFKIGVKDDAEHRGGINIFGEKFGDYAQNIVMKIKCL